MQRRSAIKSVGGIALGSTLLGNILTVSAENQGLDAYEQYCMELARKHGGIVDQGGLLNTTDTGVKAQSLGKEPETVGASALSSSKMDIDAVEELEYQDGTILTQTVRSEDGSVIKVDIGDRQFGFRTEDVNRVLSKRKNEAKKRDSKALSDGRRRRGSRNTNGGGTRSITGAGSRPPSSSDVESSNMVSAQSTDYYYSFDDSNEAGLSTPYTGGTHNNAGPDYANTSADSAGLAAASGYAEAWSDHQWSGSGELVTEFSGSYNAAAWNVLGSSELLLHFRVESGGQEINRAYALNKSSFLADYWHQEQNYTTNMYFSNPPPPARSGSI